MQATVANKGGRPASFTQALADEVCDRISNGEPLAVVCREDRMPHRSTVAGWCLAKPEFAASYAFAREIGFDAIAAECLKIADTPLEGIRTRTGKDGEEITREDMLGHRKLQIETRLKLLSKWCPQRFGDRLDVNATVAGEIRIVVGGDTN
jgi:hypothetical protein